MSYNYPDRNDRITQDLIRSVSKGNYWQESEDHVLDMALAEIGRLPSPRSMLDLGCGLGRLFHVFAPAVNSIIALEPDSERCAGAYQSASALPGHSIMVLNTDNSILVEGQTFDIILSSHVLQHIPPDLCSRVVSEMSAHTHEGSLVILTTTHTDGSSDVLTAESMADGQRHSQIVNEEEFLTLFEQKGVLPVRLFAENTIIEMFRSSRFELVLRRRFHYDGAESTDYDDAANDEIYGTSACGPEGQLPSAEKYTANARDCMYIFRRTK